MSRAETREHAETVRLELRAGKPFDPDTLAAAVQLALDTLLDALAPMDCAVRVEASDCVGFLAAAGYEPPPPSLPAD